MGRVSSSSTKSPTRAVLFSSCAYHFLVLETTRRYSPCDLRMLTSTTMVLFILVETTRPILVLRRLFFSVLVAVSAITSSSSSWRLRASSLWLGFQLSLRLQRLFCHFQFLARQPVPSRA